MVTKKEKKRVIFSLCIIAALMVVTIYAIFFYESNIILNKIDKSLLLIILSVLMGFALSSIFSIPRFQNYERIVDIITNSMIVLMGIASVVLVVFEPMALYLPLFLLPFAIMALVSLIKTIHEISNERKMTKGNTTE
jgi:hypothetical protein